MLELATVLQGRLTRSKVEATVRSWSRAQLEAVVMATTALPSYFPVTEIRPMARWLRSLRYGLCEARGPYRSTTPLIRRHRET